MAKAPSRDVEVNEASQCALWRGPLEHGTPTAYDGGKRWRAARFYYAALHGQQIERLGQLTRLCLEPLCVSPHHWTLQAPRHWLRKVAPEHASPWSVRSAKKAIKEADGFCWDLEHVAALRCHPLDLQTVCEAGGYAYPTALAAYADIVRDERRRRQWGRLARMHD